MSDIIILSLKIKGKMRNDDLTGLVVCYEGYQFGWYPLPDNLWDEIELGDEIEIHLKKNESERNENSTKHNKRIVG